LHSLGAFLFGTHSSKLLRGTKRGTLPQGANIR
jgi:hypothetical protein